MFASDFRRIAREALRDKWKKMILLTLLSLAVFDMFGLGLIQTAFFVLEETQQIGDFVVTTGRPVGFGWVIWAVSMLWSVLSSIVNVGQYRMSAVVLDGGEPTLRDLFPKGLLWKAVAMNLVRSLLVALQFMLFVIPGIIAALRYDMADYLLAQNPEMGPIEALRESRIRMRGNKGRFFCLQFSFFGWMLLQGAVLEGFDLFFGASVMNSTGSYLLAAYIVTIAGWIAGAALYPYINVSCVAFFRDVEHPQTIEPERPVFTWGESGEEPDNDADGVAPPPDSSPIENEPAARELFFAHGCSRARMREAGVLEEYENYRVDSSAEHRWMQDWGNMLMYRFSSDPAVLDDLLSLVSEYSMADLLDRAIERIARHIRQNTLPGQEVLNMLGRVLALATSGAFAGHEGYVERKKAQVADMAERLEQQLEQADPDGDWQNALRLIRRMCE
ncbi:MAG: DUF975 family protein [Clostridia bacterium]|nr:DUF975 family protein [Clostridia bacterium]